MARKKTVTVGASPLVPAFPASPPVIFPPQAIATNANAADPQSLFMTFTLRDRVRSVCGFAGASAPKA